MPSQTDIANIAITTLGGPPIVSLDAPDEAAKIAAARYADVRDAVLREHPWNCASRRFVVPAEAAPPLWGWSAQYPLPNDPYCLRLIALEDSSLRYQVEGRKILCNYVGQLKGLYIGRVSEDEFDATLCRVIGYALAAEIAYRLTQSRSQAQQMQELYQLSLRNARSIDASEGTPAPIGGSRILEAREG